MGELARVNGRTATGLVLPGFELLPTGLVPSGTPSFEEWEAAGQALRQILREMESSIHWWIGDWLTHGERAYGEKYSQALEATEYEYDTLKGDRWVASRIEMVRRRTILSFGHHKEVASLPPADQDRLLDAAASEGWSQRDLRAEVVALKSAARDAVKLESLEAVAGVVSGGAWRILHGDCRAHLGIAERPRLIFADPPYNIGVDYGDGGSADALPDEEYLQFTAEWLAVCHARLTDDGTLWVLIGDEYADHVGVLLREVGFHRRAWVKWYETFGVNCPNNFNRCSRHLFYCVKDPARFTFHAGAVNRLSDRQVKYNDARANPGGKVWDDVWQVPRLVGTAAERLPEFPTQLPLELLRPIVGCSSDPGDLVLDPFCGSGTTGVAALEAGRRFIGLERQQRFVDLATLRLKGVRQ